MTSFLSILKILEDDNFFSLEIPMQNITPNWRFKFVEIQTNLKRQQCIMERIVAFVVYKYNNVCGL